MAKYWKIIYPSGHPAYNVGKKKDILNIVSFQLNFAYYVWRHDLNQSKRCCYLVVINLDISVWSDQL